MKRYTIWIFSLLTFLMSAAVILLPLPALAAPFIVVFIPTLLAGLLVAVTDGARQVGLAMFGGSNWKISLRWMLGMLGVALALRLGVSLLGLAFGYPFQPRPFAPFYLATLLFAAAEEIGWRGYALPRALKSLSPLAATLLLGLPWSFLHIFLTLPGKYMEGVPVLALLLEMLALSVLTTWAYLGGKNSILAATLLHGGQNVLTFLNGDIPLAALNWLMAGVYLLAALAVILLTRGRLGQTTSPQTRLAGQPESP